VPLVRRTGGLADTVQQYERTTRKGTGILFDDFSPAAFAAALDEALALYKQRDHWHALVANGMREDFSWGRQTRLFVELYERLARSVTAA
jgi:starch synthase